MRMSGVVWTSPVEIIPKRVPTRDGALTVPHHADPGQGRGSGWIDLAPMAVLIAIYPRRIGCPGGSCGGSNTRSKSR